MCKFFDAKDIRLFSLWIHFFQKERISIFMAFDTELGRKHLRGSNIL